MGNWSRVDVAGATIASPPDAPNVTGVTAQVTYGLIGNLSCFGYTGSITLPTADPNYSHLKKIHVLEQWTGSAWSSSTGYSQGAVVLEGGIYYVALIQNTNITPGTNTAVWVPCPLREVATLYGPWGSSPIQFSVDPTPSDAQPSVALSTTLSFACENDDGVVTPTPYTLSLTVQAASVASVTAGDASALSSSDPKYAPRYADNTGSQFFKVWFAPVITGGEVPMVVAMFVNRGDGKGWIWVENVTVETAGQWFYQQGDQWVPTAGNETWQIACLAGWYNGDPTQTNLTLPLGAVTSATFTVVAVGPCPANDVQGAQFVPDGSSDIIEYIQHSNGIWNWVPYEFQASIPGTDDDINFWFAVLTVQKGYVDGGGTWHAAPDYEGVNEDPNGDYLGRQVNQWPIPIDPQNPTASVPRSNVYWYGDNPPDWTYPNNTNADGSTNLYRTFRFRVYAVSRQGASAEGGGTFTLQTCWPGGADHYDLTPAVHPATVDATLTRSNTLALPLTGGNGSPVTVAPGGVTNSYIGSAAVAANNMAAAAVTYANAALAANSVVSSNVASVSIGSLISGTVVFTGAVVLSRGNGYPVISMDYNGIFLFGNGTAAGSAPTPGGSGGATYTASGFTNYGYVGIQYNQIGIYGQNSGIQPSVILSGTNVTIWSNNGSTTSAYATFSSSNLTFYASNGYYAQVNTNGLLVSAGSYSLQAYATGITLQYSGGASLAMTSNQVTLSNGSGASAYIAASGYFVITTGSSTTLILGGLVIPGTGLATSGYVALQGSGNLDLTACTGNINFNSAKISTSGTITGNWLQILIGGSAYKLQLYI